MCISNLKEGEDRFSLKKEMNEKEMNGSLEDCGPPILGGAFILDLEEEKISYKYHASNASTSGILSKTPGNVCDMSTSCWPAQHTKKMLAITAAELHPILAADILSWQLANTTAWNSSGSVVIMTSVN